ncbi:hypothetical protein [Vibrio tubiashii]|uniref:hypothetical protein n=1 Tax=Vibrio tubiashii TaxID=29498 RepID=UPI00349EB409
MNGEALFQAFYWQLFAADKGGGNGLRPTENWKTGKLDDWETEELDNWNTDKMDDFKI